MSEDQSSEDRTEEPTEKRRREAREKGQLPRSRELNTLAVLLAGAGGLLLYGAALGDSLLRLMRGSFQLSRETVMNSDSMLQLFATGGWLAAEGLWPILALLLVAALVGPIALGGWLFSSEALAPKFSRLNPLAGLKRMFSAKSLLELFKALVKFVVVLLVALLVLQSDKDDLLAMAHEPMEQAIVHSAKVVGWSALWLAASLLIIAAVDVPYQLWDNRKKLMMTKQEIRDEYKDSEGKPEVKAKVRQMQREMAQRRMMQAVPTADVVITNPTHFAVALKYDAEAGGAPKLLAKGNDFIALKIREVANEHKVMVLESPALARAVYYSTELDQEIPAGLYLAVAQVLAYVYQLKQFRAGKGKRPEPLAEPPIPEDLRRDE
ncbi:flagellar biosynthesis protein FlhB [Pseudomonas schmalbachii]|uniref:Flagellar biosynthetic protein FlhB n=1 Tax=Pseudomonas schmalbachii TaxID=2816993 RepID=A0ABS3TQ24_9PSED|nr:flagellar biosynthesis protein FlhB [Pseudomonas schmalbachii]MBO3275765.1 flagellar type III secretion system protein FlhB [Pseudomonas schmalbachii]